MGTDALVGPFTVSVPVVMSAPKLTVVVGPKLVLVPVITIVLFEPWCAEAGLSVAEDEVPVPVPESADQHGLGLPALVTVSAPTMAPAMVGANWTSIVQTLPRRQRAAGKRAGGAGRSWIGNRRRPTTLVESDSAGVVVGELDCFRRAGRADRLRSEGQLRRGNRQVSLRSAAQIHQLRAVIAGIGDRDRSADLPYKRGIERDAERTSATRRRARCRSYC